MKFEMVIGLEVHIQLKTKSKIFSNARTKYGQQPNSQVSWLDIALPGTLPVLNKKATEMAIKFGLATNATISRNSFFARKNYFYPDLPKGYQISQSHNPIIQNGTLDIQLKDNSIKTINIERAHLEEDAGKSVHHFSGSDTGLDYNRAGTPLLEIVTQPEFRSAHEVITYLKTLHQLVKHIDICDGNMQEGSFRCDVNLSIREQGDKNLGTRAEIKNINSFKFIESAIHYEYDRQVNLVKSGDKIKQETRLYDQEKNETRAMRSKENAFDYRYFPDPDLLPVIITEESINKIKAEMPISLKERQAKYASELQEDDVKFLMSNSEIANYYDQVNQIIHAKKAYNWVCINLQSVFNKLQISFSEHTIKASTLIQVIKLVDNNTISLKSAKIVLQEYQLNPKDINQIIDDLGLKQSNDLESIKRLADEIIANNPQTANEYREGKTKLLGFFVGQIMKKSKGQANPKQVSEIVIKQLTQP